MTYKLWALNGYGGQAIIRKDDKWLLLSIDNQWKPLELQGLTEALHWASLMPAIADEKEFQKLSQVVKYIRETFASKGEVSSTPLAKIADLAPPEVIAKLAFEKAMKEKERQATLNIINEMSDEAHNFSKGYRLFWEIPDQVLCLQLDGDLSFNDFRQINQNILEQLGKEDSHRTVALLVDIRRPVRVPTGFAEIRASQTYVMRQDLKFILVVCNDKFMRLMMLLLFNLSKPSLRFFNDMDEVRFIQQKILNQTVYKKR
jgi:hypothetical protein